MHHLVQSSPKYFAALSHRLSNNFAIIAAKTTRTAEMKAVAGRRSDGMPCMIANGMGIVFFCLKGETELQIRHSSKGFWVHKDFGKSDQAAL